MAEADPRETFNVHDAKTNLSRLMDRVRGGEEIVLAKAGKPYAVMTPYSPPVVTPRTPGRFAHLAADVPSDIWFEPFFTPAELDRFENGPVTDD